MEWDLGLQGIAVLVAMSLGFGLVAQLIMWRATSHRFWLIAAAVYFLAGVFISEVWFGWATEEDLQPNIDGLSFDEVLLIAPFLAVAVMLVARFIVRHTGDKRHGTPA